MYSLGTQPTQPLISTHSCCLGSFSFFSLFSVILLDRKPYLPYQNVVLDNPIVNTGTCTAIEKNSRTTLIQKGKEYTHMLATNQAHSLLHSAATKFKIRVSARIFSNWSLVWLLFKKTVLVNFSHWVFLVSQHFWSLATVKVEWNNITNLHSMVVESACTWHSCRWDHHNPCDFLHCCLSYKLKNVLEALSINNY